MGIGVGAKAIGRWLLAKAIFVVIIFASWVVGVVVLYHDRKLARRVRPVSTAAFPTQTSLRPTAPTYSLASAAK
jgi:hypothetical protein